jgi:hypothetical protein
MSRLSTKQIIEKADIAVDDLIDHGGYLNPIQSDTFIRMLIDQPTLLNDIRVVPMNAPTMDINKIGFANRLLQASPGSGVALAAGSAPTTDKVSLVTKEVMAQVNIPYDVLEDNIERNRMDSTIMDMITEHASLDLEELVILGDHDSIDPYIATTDGVLVLATSNPLVYDTPPSQYDYTIFKDGILTMPTKYLRNRSALRFYTPHLIETEYNAQLGSRETGLGDTRLIEDYATKLKSFGVPIVPVALMPDTNYIFTNPKNIILGVQRKIQIERDKDITKRLYMIVLTMRIDIQIEEVDAVVVASGLVEAATT